jgi:hypothetical protein
LLFTDIQMPGSMDGLKLAHAVHSAGRRSRSSWYPGNWGWQISIFPPTAASLASRSRPGK